MEEIPNNQLPEQRPVKPKREKEPTKLKLLKLGQEVNSFMMVVQEKPLLLQIRKSAKPNELYLELGVTNRRDFIKFCTDHGIEPPVSKKLISIHKLYEILHAYCPNRYTL